MAISTNQKPTIYRNLYENTGPESKWVTFKMAATRIFVFLLVTVIGFLVLSVNFQQINLLFSTVGGGPRVVVSTAAFHARVRGSVPGLGGLKETKMFLPHPRVKVSIVGSLRDREVACSASDRQGSNFEFCVWRTVSSQSSHHPQEVLLAQFSLYVHKSGLKPDSFHLALSSPIFHVFSAKSHCSNFASKLVHRLQHWPSIR